MHRLPGSVKWTLSALSRIDTLSVGLLLDRVWAVMRDEMEEIKVAVVVWPMQNTAVHVRKYFRCNGINHMTKDCQSRQHDRG